MNIKQFNSELAKKILSSYQDNFVYVNTENLILDDENSKLSGNIIYRAAPYSKKYGISKIFNNTEAILAFNQIAYLLCFNFLKKQELYKKNSEEDIENCYKLLGNFVVREQIIKFRKPVIEKKDDLKFSCHIDSVRNTKTGIFFYFITIFGLENNIIMQTKGFMLSQDVHGIHN